MEFGAKHGGPINEYRIEIPEFDIEQPPPHTTSPRRRLLHPHPHPHPHPVPDPNPTDLPPAFDDHPNPNGRRFSASLRFRRPRHSFIHLRALTFILLLVFFFLSWFSAPVLKLAIKDGRIMQHYSATKPCSLNDTELTLSRNMAFLAVAVTSTNSSLAVAASPNPSIELMSVTDKADDNAPPVSSTY